MCLHIFHWPTHRFVVANVQPVSTFLPGWSCVAWSEPSDLSTLLWHSGPTKTNDALFFVFAAAEPLLEREHTEDEYHFQLWHHTGGQFRLASVSDAVALHQLLCEGVRNSAFVLWKNFTPRLDSPLSPEYPVFNDNPVPWQLECNAVWLHSSVIQVEAASCPIMSDYVTETRERWPLEGWPAYCTHILLCLALFPAEDWRQTTVGLWTWYGGFIGGTEYVLCALSQSQLSQECSPLALTFILGADRLVVIYRISCWQEQACHYCWAQCSQEMMVYSEAHLFHSKESTWEEEKGYLFASCI